MASGMPQSCPGTGHTQKQALIQLQWLLFHRFTHCCLFSTHLFPSFASPVAAPPQSRLLSAPWCAPQVTYMLPSPTHQLQVIFHFYHSPRSSEPLPKGAVHFPQLYVPQTRITSSFIRSASDMSCRQRRSRIWKERVSHLVICAFFKCTADRTYQKLSQCHEH